MSPYGFLDKPLALWASILWLPWALCVNMHSQVHKYGLKEVKSESQPTNHQLNRQLIMSKVPPLPWLTQHLASVGGKLVSWEIGVGQVAKCFGNSMKLSTLCRNTLRTESWHFVSGASSVQLDVSGSMLSF